MRSVRGLFSRLHEPTHLWTCTREAARGKRQTAEVAWFLFRRETELRRIAEELSDGTWRPQGFNLHLIRDPKPRAIARAPFADRVVHTAIVKLLEPVFLVSAMPADMACREGFGTGRAVIAAQRYMRRHGFVLHLDIRAFFPSLDPTCVLDLVARRVRDPRLLDVLGRVLDSGRGIVDRPGVREWVGMPSDWPPPGVGLPIGAATSQFLATHVVLQALDHHIKRVLKVPGYVRFVDDLLIFGDHRSDLRAWRTAIADWLWTERRLRLKHPNARILSSHGHLDALGQRITRHETAALPRAARRFRARLYRAARDLDVDAAKLRGTIAASVHHLLE